MSFYFTLLAATLVISLIIILTVSIKSKCFFKSLFLTAFSGLGGLFAIHIVSDFIPLSLPVNLFTALTSALAGIPGVIALLITSITV